MWSISLYQIHLLDVYLEFIMKHSVAAWFSLYCTGFSYFFAVWEVSRILPEVILVFPQKKCRYNSSINYHILDHLPAGPFDYVWQYRKSTYMVLVFTVPCHGRSVAAISPQYYLISFFFFLLLFLFKMVRNTVCNSNLTSPSVTKWRRKAEIDIVCSYHTSSHSWKIRTSFTV